MRKYFLYEGGRQVGPFSIQELSTKTINHSTPVWTDGLKNWSTAGQIDELRALLFAPPPFEGHELKTLANSYSYFASATEKTGFQIGRFLGGKNLIFICIFIVASVAYFYARFANNGTYDLSPSHSEEELRELLKLEEQRNPGKYIEGKYYTRKNLFGEQVVEIELKNSAKVADFKDIQINMSFLTPTQTKIGEKKYTIYRYLNAGQTTKHKLKAFAPSGTADVGITILGAKAY